MGKKKNAGSFGKGLDIGRKWGTLEAWKKGAVVGAVLGCISFACFYVIKLRLISGTVEGHPIIAAIVEMIWIVNFILLLLLTSITRATPFQTSEGVIILLAVCHILIGVVIGALIGFVVDVRRVVQKRTSIMDLFDCDWRGLWVRRKGVIIVAIILILLVVGYAPKCCPNDCKYISAIGCCDGLVTKQVQEIDEVWCMRPECDIVWVAGDFYHGYVDSCTYNELYSSGNPLKVCYDSSDCSVEYSCIHYTCQRIVEEGS